MKNLLIISFLLLLGLNGFGQNGEILTIRFESNVYEISLEDEKKIDEIIELCNSEEFYFLKVFGYTDTTGTENYNVWLSKMRCYAVWNYIKKKTKVDENKFYMEWLGESNNTYHLHFDEAHAQERCVDIWVHLNKKN